MRIKDKNLFKKQMSTIVISILMIVGTILVAHYLRQNGFDGFFTTNLYKEAFETNPNDIVLINRIEAILIISILALGYQELKYNEEIQMIEREEEELCMWLLEH